MAKAKAAGLSPRRRHLLVGAGALWRKQSARLNAGPAPAGAPRLSDADAVELAGILDTFERCGIGEAVLDFDDDAPPDAFEAKP